MEKVSGSAGAVRMPCAQFFSKLLSHSRRPARRRKTEIRIQTQATGTAPHLVAIIGWPLLVDPLDLAASAQSARAKKLPGATQLWRGSAHKTTARKKSRGGSIGFPPLSVATRAPFSRSDFLVQSSRAPLSLRLPAQRHQKQQSVCHPPT
jgi:hypothetical protein